MSSDASTLIGQVKGFTDQELREKLTGLGMDVGPITGTTRTLYERKLIQMLTGSLPESGTGSRQTPPEPTSKPSLRKSSPVLEQATYGTSSTLVSDTTDAFDQSHQPAESTIHLIRASPILEKATYGISSTLVSDTTDAFDQSHQPAESTIHLIRARKPVSRVVVEEPVSRKSFARQTTLFPAANAQFRKTEPVGSFMDHTLKFVLFGIVMLVIVYFIVNQEPGKAVEHRP